MSNISKIKAEAQKAIEKLVSGKTYTSKYALDRLNSALDSHPRDVLIGTMRDAIKKHAESNSFITQAKIGSMYNHLCGFSSNRALFRQHLEDMLPPSSNFEPKISKDASSSRGDEGGQLMSLAEDTALSKELSGVFSLDSNYSIPNYGNNTVKRAEKFASAQLKSIGHPPFSISAVRSNDHFILCNASYRMANHDPVSVSIPVQVTNGSPSLPQHFVSDGQLVDLNKDNLFLHLKESQLNSSGKKSYAEQRRTDKIFLEKVNTPEPLEGMARIDDALVVAASKFSRDQVKLASNVVSAELSGYGVVNPQVSVFDADDIFLKLSADIPTKKGRLSVIIPVDMSNGTPTLPSDFSFEKRSYEFSQSGFSKFAKDISANQDSYVNRQIKDMGKESYHGLVDAIIEGVSSKDYRMAEDALSTIQAKFGDAQYKVALEKFSKLLKYSSEGSERDKMIKNALKSGDLIMVPTSIEPYSPKLGLPASKVTFDEKGRLVPMRKSSKLENMNDSGAMTYKNNIVIS